MKDQTRPARPVPAQRVGGGRSRAPARRSPHILIKLLKWSLILGLAVAALAAAGGAAVFWMWSTDPKLPRIYALRDYQPKQTIRVLAADGRVIGEIFEERRTFVPLDRISPHLVQAVIDAEDANFRTHQGLDWMGIVRATWVNLRSGETRQGASTITQQVVKTFLLTPERTIKRKMQEAILARRLEQTLTKDDILTLYLNQIYFGHGRYGVEEAARYFFAKSAIELNVGEAALLAGLPQSPERLSPRRHPEAAKARQSYVLEQMARNGHLPEAEARRWIAAPIGVVKDPEPTLGGAPEIVDLVRRELATRHSEAELATMGGTVRTTIDLDLQTAARQALEDGLRALDTRHGYAGPVARLAPGKVAARLKKLTRDLPEGGPRSGQTYEGIVVEVSDQHEELVVDLGGWKGGVVLRGPTDARYNPQGKRPSERFAPNDLVYVRLAPEAGPAHSSDLKGVLALELGPQGAVVAIDPQTRHVLALVGGYAFQPGQFDRALLAKRQPGSSFKPFVYAAALDSGELTAASIVNDAPEVYDLWKPKNYEAGNFRGPVRLRQALALSINTVAIRVIHDVGPARVVELARSMGIDEDLPKELSLALGSGVVTPLEMTNAFATFAAGGTFAPPVFFTDALAAHAADQPSRPALRPEVAYVLTSMMQSVVEEGTATAARKLKRAIAGKTGTSNGGKDAWFVGFTPDLVAGVWIGFDDMRSLGKGEAGGKAALPIWIDLMKVALKGRPARTFRAPPGIVVVRIDKQSGKLAPAGAPEADTLDEVFLQGTEPTETAPAPGEVDPASFILDEMEAGGAGAAGAAGAGPSPGGPTAGNPGAGTRSGGGTAAGVGDDEDRATAAPERGL